MKNIDGLSFLLVFGSWGGFHYTATNHSIHLCLGFVAFTVFFYDVEDAMAKTLKENNNAN